MDLEILGFILHFNWGEKQCGQFIEHLKENKLLFESSFIFMLFDSKSSSERRNAFVWGAKEVLDPYDSKSIDVLKDNFITYYTYGGGVLLKLSQILEVDTELFLSFFAFISLLILDYLFEEKRLKNYFYMDFRKI